MSIWTIFQVLIAAAVSALVSCDACDGDAQQEEKIAAALADDLTEALRFTGGEAREGAPPAPSSSGQAPVPETLHAPASLVEGAAFELSIAGTATVEVASAVVFVKGASSYIVVKVSPAVVKDRIVTVLGGDLSVDEDITGHEFDLQVAWQTGTGVTSEYLDWHLTILKEGQVSIVCSPELVSTFKTPSQPYEIFYWQDKVIIAERDSGVHILDVADPRSISLLGSFDTDGLANGVAIRGNYAYVSDDSAGLVILDVTDPADPVRLGGYDTPSLAMDAWISAGVAYVADYDNGLVILDVNDPANPALLRNVDTPGYSLDIEVSSQTAFIADREAGLTLIDVADPANPALYGTYDYGTEIRAVTVRGNIAYMAAGTAGLIVINVSQINSPVEIARFNTADFADDLVRYGDTLFIADRTGGVILIDVTDAANMKLLGRLSEPTDVRAISVNPPYLYVADLGGQQILVYDIEGCVE